MPTAYLASPLGFSPATRLYYTEVLLPAVVAAGVEPLDPWADPDGATQAEFEAALAEPDAAARLRRLAGINRRLGAANAEMIAAADAVLAILDGVDVDSGTAAEIGYASALGKPVVGLRLDTRRTGENEAAVVNLQVVHFIEAGGGAICEDLEAAVHRLRALAG